MEKVIAYILAGIVGGFVYIALLAYSVFSWGYVLYVFYGWFVEPVYVDIPHITLNQAFGLTLVVSLFKNHTASKEYEGLEESNKLGQFVAYSLAPWMSLLSGYLVYSHIL